ncbi:MAG: hypothetical protein GY865_14265 [candidate division Zixibacteria bacterium]|nr:hypothetical protein [candidate division Zixibacteria bacterium]
MDFSDGNYDEPIGEEVESICENAKNNLIECDQSIIDAAIVMNNKQLNHWIYLALREDGMTIWQAPDESGIATVSLGGDINISLM